MKYHLQTRWVLEGDRLYYYGLRRKENLFKNEIKLKKPQLDIIRSLPRELSDNDISVLGRLFGEQIVPENELRAMPRSVREARFCKNCAANDFIIPGLEFDDDGLCPMCATKAESEGLKSVVPLLDDIPRAKHSRFDAALFYTGGKDSTYLLYYLAKVKGLRILALTWEIPYMSDSARQSIENAKRSLDTVEFISRSVMGEDMKKIYKKLYELADNTCACPSLAYLLFYPELVANRVPYFLAGNEPAQALGLYYNHMAPKIAYSFADNRFLQGLFNVGRVITLRPPLRRGQFHALATMKQLAFGDNIIKKASGYENSLVSNIVTAIHEVPSLLPPLKRAIRYSSRTGHIPAFVALDFDKISGGIYDWRAIKDTIIRECGWVEPEDGKKALHTSCKIEKCKDHSQFLRFYNCKSRMIPFSAIEISLASRDRALSREDAIYEQETLLGFSLEELPECALMCEYLKI